MKLPRGRKQIPQNPKDWQTAELAGTVEEATMQPEVAISNKTWQQEPLATSCQEQQKTQLRDTSTH